MCITAQNTKLLDFKLALRVGLSLINGFDIDSEQ